MIREPIPDGRVIRNPDEEGAITLDFLHYGDAYVRGPIPEWWGELGKYVEHQMMQQRDLTGVAAIINGT